MCITVHYLCSIPSGSITVGGTYSPAVWLFIRPEGTNPSHYSLTNLVSLQIFILYLHALFCIYPCNLFKYSLKHNSSRQLYLWTSTHAVKNESGTVFCSRCGFALNHNFIVFLFLRPFLRLVYMMLLEFLIVHLVPPDNCVVCIILVVIINWEWTEYWKAENK